MAWMRTVCGRLKSDYRYSVGIVYNNFPWPELAEEQRSKTEACAKAVLDARERCPESSLADLYTPLTMPAELLKAHEKLDSAVKKAYGSQWETEAECVAFLMKRYQEMTAPK